MHERRPPRRMRRGRLARARRLSAAPREHRDRVLPRGVRPLLHHAAARGDRRARLGPFTGWSRTGRGFAVVLGAPPGPASARLPLLHPAAARRLALLLGVDRGVRDGPRQDRRRPQLQRLHRRVAQRVLHRAAEHRDRRVSRRDRPPCTACGTSARIPIIATRPTPASRRRCSAKGYVRRRLRPRCGRDVHARSRCSSTRSCPTSGAVAVHAGLRRRSRARHRLRQRRSRADDRRQSRRIRTT